MVDGEKIVQEGQEKHEAEVCKSCQGALESCHVALDSAKGALLFAREDLAKMEAKVKADPSRVASENLPMFPASTCTPGPQVGYD